MRGAIGSLNAAVAGSILLFAAVAQRDPAGLGDKPARPVAAEAWPVRNEPSAPRGQSVGLPSPTEEEAEPATQAGVEPAPARRRAAPKAAKPAPRAAKGVRSAATAVPTAVDSDVAAEIAAETAKARRGSARKATTGAEAAAAPPGEPLSETPAPRRVARKTRSIGTDPDVANSGSRKLAAPKATKTTKSTKSTKSTKGKPTTRTKAATAPKASGKPADDGSPNGDELLPGGPDPT
jgi:hypothetical protein